MQGVEKYGGSWYNLLMRRKDREVTDEAAVREILAACRTCRVAMISDGMPYVVPLSYGWDLEGGVLTLHFHSAAEGRKIDALAADGRVCFEISREGELYSDAPCNTGYRYSSVLGFGRAEFVTDPAEKCASLSALMLHHTGRRSEFTPRQADTVCVFRIVSSDFTAKRR
mgnify:FL=1